jgi:hypothetical protein
MKMINKSQNAIVAEEGSYGHEMILYKWKLVDNAVVSKICNNYFLLY